MKSIKLMIIVFLGLLTAYSTLQAQNPPRLQAVHNVPDPLLAVGDVYILSFGVELAKIEDLAFRTAIPYVDAIGGLPLDVGVAPGNSTSAADTVASFVVQLTNGLPYSGIIHGVADPAMFAANPNGRDINLAVYIRDDGREISTVAGETQFYIFHGVTDGPTVDVVVRGGSMLADNLAYGDATDYLSVAPMMYTIDLVDVASGNLVAGYDVDLTAFADTAMVVMASGFADPAANQNGEPLALIGITAGGTTLTFPQSATGLEEEPGATVQDFVLKQNYPNPFNPSTTIEFALPAANPVTIGIYNATGQRLETLVSAPYTAGTHAVRWDARNYPSGVYFYRIQAGDFVQTNKMMLLK